MVPRPIGAGTARSFPRLFLIDGHIRYRSNGLNLGLWRPCITSLNKGKNMRRRITYMMSLSLTVIALIFFWNYVTVQRHISQVIEHDARNEGIEIFAHYQWFINPKILVFDLRNVSDEKSPMDVSRTLLQFAEKSKNNNYESVILSYKGNPRFVLNGIYFKTLGNEYGFQNPVYTLRTLPENVYAPDGTPAFGKWTGGWIGVVGQQLEDLNEFHRRWYLTDVIEDK